MRRGLLALVAAVVTIGCAGSPSDADVQTGGTGQLETAAGGSAPGSEVAAPAAPNQASASGWTVMIYMDVDNNLEAQKIRYNLEDAARIGSGNDLNVIVLIDRSSEDTSDPSAPDANLGSIPAFTGAKLVRVDRGGFSELQDLGEIDMGDPQTLAWFVRQGVTQFPANHYSLWIADHGAGISGAAWDDSTPPDSVGRLSNLKLPEITAGIRAGLSGTGVSKLDMVGYDACLMATYDAALMLTPVADWLMASEEVTLTNTWKYGAALQSVAGNPSATGETLGRALVENSNDPGWPIGTNGLIDLGKMGIVQQSVESLANALTEAMPQIAGELGRQRGSAPEFGIDPNTGQNQGYSLVDLGDLTSRLQNMPPAVEAARSSVYAAVDNAVVSLVNGPAATQATGLAMYFPVNIGFYDSEFDTFSTSGPWRRMLNAFYQSGADVGPGPGPGPNSGTIAFESTTATVQLVEGGVVTSGRLKAGTEGTIVDARFAGGVLFPDGTVHHLVLSPAVIGSGGDPRTIAAGWSLGAFQLTDGTTALVATASITGVPGAALVEIPLLYQNAAGQQSQGVLQLIFDGSGQLMAPPILIGYAADGSTAILQPQAGSLIAPLVLVSKPGGQAQLQLVGDTALDATGFGFEFVALGGGQTFHVALAATDATGATASATGTGTVP